MNHMDARGVLAAKLLSGGHRAKKRGATIEFQCPRHADATASAWLGDHQWGCSACGFTEHFDTLADAIGVTLPEPANKGLTITEYAERKGLALDKLAKYGLEERVGKYGDAVVAIPYRGADGQVIRTKVRTRKGTFWEKDGEGTPLYGQDIVAKTPKTMPVVIVEGESDCHAGWQRQVCAVGLPGASQWKSEYAPLLAGRQVYVWQEPDEGGATLVSSVARDLPKALVIRDVQYHGTPVKDLCDLHQAVQANSGDWASAWKAVLEKATPIGAEAPAVQFDSLTGDTLVQMLAEKLQPIDAIPTPLDGWNLMCGGAGGSTGLARGWNVVIGANTGTGKSLIGLNLAAKAIQHGETVCFISLEMTRSELGTRLLSVVSGEHVKHLEQGAFFDLAAYERAAASLDAIREETGGHVLVNRKPISTLVDVKSCVAYHAEVYGCRYFILDYIQLAHATGHDIREKMEAVSGTVRILGHQHNATMIALSQFNRDTSANRDERPLPQGLMGGSAIENDAHQVLLFDHSRFVRTGNQADTWLLLAKNRNGSVIDLPVRWDFDTLRLSSRIVGVEVDQAEKKHGRLTKHGRGY
jgi:hypothetical protein